MPGERNDPIQRVGDWLSTARRVAVLTGAGVSAESGLPTFRGAGSGWAGFNDASLASPDGFTANPDRVWQWHEGLRARVAEVTPNAAHRALAELGRRLGARGGRLTLITQNIDGLHQRAGSEGVLELHGSLLRARCMACRQRIAMGIDVPITRTAPACGGCGQPLRPDVVWFGEALPAETLDQAVESAADCELFLSVGTSAVVYPAAGLIDLALRSGARTVEINPQPTAYTPRLAASIRGPAGDILARLIEPCRPPHPA